MPNKILEGWLEKRNRHDFSHGDFFSSHDPKENL